MKYCQHLQAQNLRMHERAIYGTHERSSLDELDRWFRQCASSLFIMY